jgi:ElaB/YqjD/DUF883 family membrane-anchored ribosome-binding protein
MAPGWWRAKRITGADPVYLTYVIARRAKECVCCIEKMVEDRPWRGRKWSAADAFYV